MFFLIKHSWLSFRRSKFFASQLAVQIVSMVFGSFALVVYLFFGYHLDKVLGHLHVQSGALTFLNQYLALGLAFSAALQLFFQSEIGFDFRPYLHLPVSRRRLAAVLVLLNSVRWKAAVYITPFLLGAALKLILPDAGFTAAVFWLMSAHLFYFTLTAIVFLLKISVMDRAGKSLLILPILVIVVWVTSKFPAPGGVWSAGFQAVSSGSLPAAMSYLLYFGLVFAISVSVLHWQLTLDFSGAKQRAGKRAGFFRLPENFSPFLLLAARQILRSRQLRKGFFYLLFGLAIGLVFLFAPVKPKFHFLNSFSLSIFCSGAIFQSIYMGNTFGWDHNQMSLLLATPLNFRAYLNGKIHLIWLLLSGPAVLYLVLAFVKHQPIYLVFSIYTVYIMGANTYVELMMSLLTYTPANPDLPVWGTAVRIKPVRVFITLPLIILPFGLLELFRNGSLWGVEGISLTGLLAMAAGGIVWFVFHPFWLSLVERLFNKQRLEIVERGLI